MITYVTSQNLAKYTALFDKATTTLRGLDPEHGGIGPDERIEGLNDYFSYITTLVGEDEHYAILPLDEDIFEIDANSRTITVPKSFQNDGISVQGDEVSEILYFKINRYFDATDLNECKIFIEWENAPDSTGKSDQGVSREWIRDVTSEPDYLIFGWPVSSVTTKRPGTIKFAVRFYLPKDETDLTKGLLYSFSTLTASATIKQALDFSIDTSAIPPQEDLHDLVKNRLRDAEVIPEGEAPMPIYWPNWNLPDKIVNKTGPETLAVQAYAAAGGSISYTWKFLTPFEAKKPAEETKTVVVYSSTADYRNTSDTSRVAGKIYYFKVTDGVFRFWDGSVPAADGTPLYEKVGTLSANKCGAYFAEAVNRTGKKMVSQPFASNQCTFLKKPVVNTALPARINNLTDVAVINSDVTADAFTDGEERISANENLLDFVWTRQYKEDGVSKTDTLEAKTPSITVNAYGRYALQVRNALTIGVKEAVTDFVDGGLCRVTRTAPTPVITLTGVDEDDPSHAAMGKTLTANLNIAVDNENTSDVISYQWYKVKSSGNQPIQGAILASYKPEAEGRFYVKVTNELNGSESFAESSIITVD